MSMTEHEIKVRYNISFGIAEEDVVMAPNAKVPDEYVENVEEFYESPFHQWFDEMFLGSAIEDATRGYYNGIMGGLIELYLDDEGQPMTCLGNERGITPMGKELAWVRYSINKESM